MKKTIRSRSLQLLGLAARVSQKEITQTVKEAISRGIDEVASGRAKVRIEQAKIIAETLSQLKGAAMKAGQLLSIDASDLLPPEAIEILSKLQSKADPIDTAIIERVLLEDLGAERIKEFEFFDKQAAASASIGQVHRARLHGQDVAVKVQYPGITDSIDSDIRILKTMGQSLLALSGKKISLDELFEELATVLKQEANYGLERDNMIEYHRLLSPYPEYAAPQPILSHSSPRVITMTWQEGLSVQAWLKTQPSKSQREKVGRLVLDLYCKEFFDWGFVQTDPNYANFLIQPENLRLVLLDFGATLRYSNEFRNYYIGLLRDLESIDQDRIIKNFTSLGLIDARESDEAKKLFVDLMLLSIEPFQPHLQPFKFTDSDYAQRSRDIARRFTQSLKYSPPPRQILFLHRKLGGIFNLLRKLETEIDLTPYWKEMVNKTKSSD